MKRNISKKKVTLLGIAGNNSSFSLSLYNLKAYALRHKEISKNWTFNVIQEPLINADMIEKNAKNRIVKLLELIIDEKPDLLVLSCYCWNRKVFQKITQEIRTKLPKTLILWGGPEVVRQDILDCKLDDLEADYFVFGEGEETFYELLKYLTFGEPTLSEILGLSYLNRIDNDFVVNEKRPPFKSLNEIPSPYLTGHVDDEVLSRDGIEAIIETQRGCSLRCAYCVYHKDMNKISYASVDQRVLDEVLFLCSKGVKSIRFADANFTSDLTHAKNIMRNLIDKRVESNLYMELIPGFIDEEFAELLGEYNSLHEWNEITLGIGVQTINLEVLKRLRRGIKLDKFEKTFDLLQKYNIYSKIDLIFGLPGEDINSIERTLDYFVERLKNSSTHVLCCHVLLGLPGTELMEIAEDYGMTFSSKYETHEFVESPLLPLADKVTSLRRAAVVFRLVNHLGWTGRELLNGKSSDSTSVRDCFFSTRDRLGLTNIGLVDLLVEELIPYLAKRNATFSQPDFPYAEAWWWVWSKYHVSNKWLIGTMKSFSSETFENRIDGVSEKQNEVIYN